MRIRINIDKSVIGIIMLYIVSILYTFTTVKTLGFIAMVLLLSFPLLHTLMEMKIKKNKILIIFLLITIYNLFLLAYRYRSIQSIYYCMLQILIIGFVLCASSLEFLEYRIIYFCSIIEKIAIIILVYNFILKILDQFIYISYSTNKYAIRTVLFGMLLVGLYTYKDNKIHLYRRMIIYSLVFFVLTERTMALGMLLLPIFHFLIGKIASRKLYRFFFGIYFILLLSFPVFYVQLYKTPYAVELNRIVNYYTHKNLFSGRQTIWNMALELIKESPFVGYGMGTFSFIYSEVQMSVHNIYLYFLLQGGLINLVLISIFFFSVFDTLYLHKNTYDGRLAISILLMVMFLGDFGLILFANDILYSIYLWTAVCIGLIKKREKKWTGA